MGNVALETSQIVWIESMEQGKATRAQRVTGVLCRDCTQQ